MRGAITGRFYDNDGPLVGTLHSDGLQLHFMGSV